MMTDDKNSNNENPFGTLPATNDPVDASPSMESPAAPASGLGALWKSTVKLTEALGERTKEIDQNLGISKAVVKVSQDIDHKFKVQENAAVIGSSIGNTAKDIDSKFAVSQTTMNIGSAIGNTAKDLDARFNVVGTLKGFEEKTKVVETSSNMLASGANWATGKIKPKKDTGDDDDENW